MNIKTIITIVCLFFIVSPTYAAMSYPEFGGITLSETTTAAEYIVYFFNLAIAAGTLIAVAMIVMAGVEWVTSSGNPSKVESAKGKISNTLLGVGVLLGCYIILRTINPQLTIVQINDLYCEHGLVVKVQRADTGKIERQCIDGNKSEIKDTILSTVKWNFPTDYLLKVYSYSGTNYLGVVTEYNCESGTCSGDVAGAKSIYFVLNSPGIYLFDGNSYTPANPAVKSYPLYTAKNIPDLSKVNSFDNLTKSLKIVNPDQTESQKISYYAVVFKDQNYQGRCAFVAQSIPDMDSSAVNGYYTDTVGDDTISSIIVAKSDISQSAILQDRGQIILYSKTNCGKSDTDTTEQIKACPIDIGSASEGQIDILAECANHGFTKGIEVKSFEITGDAGLVLSTSNAQAGDSKTACMYFDKSSLDQGTCYKSIMDSPIFTVGGRIPLSFIVIPNN